MASKKKIAKAVKKTVSKPSPKAMLGSLATKAKSALGMKPAMGRARGGFRRRRKSAMWYAKEIARIKLKRRYDKIRLKI
jgi:hypothetical protein